VKSTLFAVSLVVITGCGAKRKAAGKDSVAPADAGLAAAPDAALPDAAVALDAAAAPAVDPTAAWVPAPRVAEPADPDVAASPPAPPVDPAVLAAQRVDKRVPCPTGDALAALGRGLFTGAGKTTATCLAAQHDRPLWVIHAAQLASDPPYVLALVDAQTKATLSAEPLDVAASSSAIADLDGDGHDELLDEVYTTEHQEGMTELVVSALGGGHITRLGGQVLGATGVIPPDGRAPSTECASRMKLVPGADQRIALELATRTSAAPPAYCPTRGRHVYDWTGTEFRERVATARDRAQTPCPTGPALAALARDAFEADDDPAVQVTATCWPVRGAAGRWLIEGTVRTPASAGAAATEAHVKALIEPDVSMPSWSEGVDVALPAGVAAATRLPRKRTVIDLDGDGRDEIVDELVDDAGGATTRRLAVASLGGAERADPFGWLKLAGPAGTCDSTVALVPGPDATRLVDVTTTGAGDPAVCPPAGHHLYAWRAPALVEVTPAAAPTP
jgi:hypothetical protein